MVLQITLAFVSLYNLMGWSAFVGVAIMIFSIPLNTCEYMLQLRGRFLMGCSYREDPQEDAGATNEEQGQEDQVDE